MIFEPREYQEQQIIDTSKRLAKSKRVILCLPTGGGKTVIFSTIISRYLAKNAFNRCLVLTDRIELFGQTFKSLSKIGVEPEIYSAQQKKGSPISARCVVAMIETVKRRGTGDLGNFDLIIIDEAHKGNFNKIFELCPNSMYIGATATPISSKKSDPLKNYYNDISFIIDVPELIQKGFLCQNINFQMEAINESNLVKRNGEYTEQSQALEFSKPQVYEGIIQYLRDIAKGRKTMVFCVNIDESIKTAERLINHGYKDVFYVHSRMSKEERKANLSAFHNSESGIMCNCGILTTGYDHPAIDCIVLLRATLSLPLYLQMCGRGSRIHEGKDSFLILDFGGNIHRFGVWDAEKDWRKTFLYPPKKNEGVAPVKTCPECEALVSVSITVCPFCGYEYPPPKEKEYIEGTLKSVGQLSKDIKGKKINDLSIEQIHKLRQEKKWTLNFIYRILAGRNISDVISYGKMLNYKNGWHRHQKGEPINSNFIIK
jgi:superfamily II DNA or RNA helicase